MLKSEQVIINAYHKIKIDLMRDLRGALLLVCQEVETDPNEPGVYKFMLYQSWSATIAREKFPRCTRRVIEAFWNQHIGEARARANARAEVVRNACTPSV